ncbi:MAG: LOG family protein [Bacteroidetes bacterium]|nr:LOG family protein [Bacteroidota bacterium]
MTKEKNRALLSYEDKDFISSDAGRIIRILSEYEMPKYYFKEFNIERTITVFGSARQLSKSAVNKYPQIAKAYQECEEIVDKLLEWSLSLPKEQRYYICTGGGPGFMEAANKASFHKKVPSLGFNINLPFEQESNKYVNPNLGFEFHYFFMRKFWFTKLSKALIVMPGGFGTLDELFENLTLIQTNRSAPKPIVLYSSDFWDRIVDMGFMKELGFISPEDTDIYCICNTPDECANYLITELEKEQSFIN